MFIDNKIRYKTFLHVVNDAGLHGLHLHPLLGGPLRFPPCVADLNTALVLNVPAARRSF